MQALAQRFNGVFTALITPFKDGAVDTAAPRSPNLGLNDHRQREHSRAADTAEKIVVLIHEGETGECPAA